MTIEETTFVNELWRYYNENARMLPWRLSEPDGTYNPYKILVSEFMLQQTQVGRVIPKFTTFLERFPSFESLASAQLSEVVALWSGLGYNRRAKYLHEAAKQIASREFPVTIDALRELKGVGYNTAAAVLTYTYNQPHKYIETNIRTVYLHYFFCDKNNVSDAELTPFIDRTLDRKNPREFMWAIMDLGTFLKSNGVRNISNSKHYTKQSKFEGSLRQMRGEILRLAQTSPQIKSLTVANDSRYKKALSGLVKDGLVVVENNQLRIG